MYDLSSKFNTFYTSYVVLSQDEQNNLHNKKDLNVQRLKDGLKEYNIENNTSYTIAETCVQGSVAMSTVVQNEDGDYDIDVAVVFDKNVLGDRGGTSYKKLSGKCTKTNGHWGQTPLLFRNFVPVLAILTLQTVLNNNIKTAEDVETYLGLNTLVVVPDFGSKKKSRRRRKD